MAWYNCHPDYADKAFDLSGERAVIVGNGNVALDVARVLLADKEALAKTDIADHALTALHSSRITEVVLLARRGVAQAAYTIGEFMAMGDLPGVDVIIDPRELVLDEASRIAREQGTLDSTVETKVRMAEEFAAREAIPGNKRVVFRYLVSPQQIQGSTESGVTAIECVRNTFVESPGTSTAAVQATDEVFILSTSLVTRAIGYIGAPLDDVPFDELRGVVPNDNGRVLDSPDGTPLSGIYVAGWVKRGATGGIGMNRVCGEETARAVIADFMADNIPNRAIEAHDDLSDLATERGASVINRAGWLKIDTAERVAGEHAGRIRLKFATVNDLYAAGRLN